MIVTLKTKQKVEIKAKEEFVNLTAEEFNSSIVSQFLQFCCDLTLSVQHNKKLCVSSVLSSLFDSQSQSSLYSPQLPLSSSGSETSLQPPSQPLWRECKIYSVYLFKLQTE